MQAASQPVSRYSYFNRHIHTMWWALSYKWALQSCDSHLNFVGCTLHFKCEQQCNQISSAKVGGGSLTYTHSIGVMMSNKRVKQSNHWCQIISALNSPNSESFPTHFRRFRQIGSVSKDSTDLLLLIASFILIWRFLLLFKYLNTYDLIGSSDWEKV